MVQCRHHNILKRIRIKYSMIVLTEGRAFFYISADLGSGLALLVLNVCDTPLGPYLQLPETSLCPVQLV